MIGLQSIGIAFYKNILNPAMNFIYFVYIYMLTAFKLSRITYILQNINFNKEQMNSCKFMIKGPVCVILCDRPAMQRYQCPIYNGTLETLILSTM